MPPDHIGETAYYRHVVQGVVVTADTSPCGVLLWGLVLAEVCPLLESCLFSLWGFLEPVALLPGETGLPPLARAAPYVSSF